MLQGYDSKECAFCGTPTMNVSTTGQPMCDWCSHQISMNEEIPDDIKYWQSICNHPKEHRDKGRCLFCNEQVGDGENKGVVDVWEYLRRKISGKE